MKGTCKTAYQEEEIKNMRKEARKITYKKAHAKRYSPTTRHQRYVSSKNPHLKPKSPNATNATHTHIPAQPKSSSQKRPNLKMTLLEYVMLKGFEKMESLVTKEIKRNNSPLLPPLRQQVHSEKQ